MPRSKKVLSPYSPVPLKNPGDIKVGVVVSEYNIQITEALFKGAVGTLVKQGIKKENIIRRNVPGAFELPLGAFLLDQQNQPDVLICLGCIMTGETRHAEYLSQAITVELLRLSTSQGKPYIFGVLTPDNESQAKARAGGKSGNKGVEAAMAAVKMIAQFG